MNQELSENDIPSTSESVEESSLKHGMLLWKVNKSKMTIKCPDLISNSEDKNDTVDNVFNVQHDKLVIKSVS